MYRKIGVCEASELFWFVTEETEQSATRGAQGLCHFQCGGLLTSWRKHGSHRISQKIRYLNLKMWNNYLIIKLKCSRNRHWALSCKYHTTHLSSWLQHCSMNFETTWYRKANKSPKLAIIMNSCTSPFTCKSIIHDWDKIPSDVNMCPDFNVFS